MAARGIGAGSEPMQNGRRRDSRTRRSAEPPRPGHGSNAMTETPPESTWKETATPSTGSPAVPATRTRTGTPSGTRSWQGGLEPPSWRSSEPASDRHASTDDQWRPGRCGGEPGAKLQEGLCIRSTDAFHGAAPVEETMATRYEHTQPGYVTLGAVGGVALALSGTLIRKAAAAKFLPGILLLGAVGSVFSSLTIVVTDKELLARFGPGVTVKRVKLADVRSVEAVRNPWYYGWGIRVTPRGMLYNVSGFDAVEVRMRTGKVFRLGTDEPDRLVRAIEEGRAPAG
jgi:hypothetical protein